MSDENKENNQDIEKQENNKSWWGKLLGLNPTYRLKAKKIIICFCILLIILLCKFGYEQYQIYDFKKRYKEAPIGSVIKTGNMKLPRSNHSCIKLNDGNILVVGGNKGAEIFNPKIGQYKLIDKKLPEFNGALQNSILLPNNNVLIAGYYIFNTKNNKIIKIKNADKYLSKDNLSMSSMDAIYPISISKNEVLVFGDNIPLYNSEDKVIIYYIDKNYYKDYKINLPYKYKNLIGRGSKYIKQDNYIYFILASASKIIKWNFITNKIEYIKEYSSKWQQIYALDNENILLSNGYVNNEAIILNLKNNNIYPISNLNKHIYGLFPISKSVFIIFTSNEQKNNNIEIYKLNLSDKTIHKLDLNYVDNYYFNFQYIYSPQMISGIQENMFLYAGGQNQTPINTRIKKSVILKIGAGRVQKGTFAPTH